MTDHSAHLLLCHGSCRLLKPRAAFLRADGHTLNTCSLCRKKAARDRYRANPTIMDRMAAQPRVPTGLHTLPAWEKRPRGQRGGRTSKQLSLFRNLPPHLRPIAHERLQWMLRRHPQSGPGTPKYPIIVANVASMTICVWREAARGTNYGNRMNAWAHAKSFVRRKAGVESVVPADERRRLSAERDAAQRARAFVPSKSALSLALSIPYATTPYKAKKLLTLEAKQRRMRDSAGDASTASSAPPSSPPSSDPFVVAGESKAAE